MGGLFNNSKKHTNEHSMLSTEMIDVQVNDYVVPALIKAYTELKDAIDNFNIYSPYAVMKNKQTKRIVDRIDQIITSRFGFRVKHMATDTTVYATLPAPANNYNVINKTIEEGHDNVEDYMKQTGKRTEDVATVDQIDTDANYEDAVIRWKNSIDKIDQQMNLKGVVVNRQNAKIENLPKDYVVFLLANFYGLFRVWKLTPSEAVGIVMHEIGHAFTHIEYSYLTLNNTSVLVDSLQDNLINKNRTFKKSLILAYQDATGEEVARELEDKNTIVATVSIMTRFTASHKYMAASTHADTDSEQLADQFSGRFGLSAELVSGLSKIHEQFDDTKFIRVVMGHLQLLALMSVWAILIAGPFGFIIGPAVYVGLFFITLIADVISDILTDGQTNSPLTYDELKQRLRRMRNEVVRQLRTVKLDKKVIKGMLDSLEVMDKTISKVPKEKVSLVASMIRKFSSKAQFNMELKDIEETIEDMMENDLHIASSKLKTI